MTQQQLDEIDVDAVREQDRGHVWHPLFQHRALEDQDLMVIREGNGCTFVDVKNDVRMSITCCGT